MSKFTTLFFDVDNTLLDFYSAEATAIRQLFKKYDLPNDDKTISLYSGINDGYWKKLEAGEMKKSDILVARFADTLKALGQKRNPAVMNNDYFGLLSACCFTVDGATEILEYLKGENYKIYATSNGLSITQERRIRESGIGVYLDGAFVSEKVGFEKPDKRYFNTVIQSLGIKDISEILVIGDSMTSDIQGGKNCGLKTCWYDAYGEEKLFTPDYTVKKLSELKNIL